MQHCGCKVQSNDNVVRPDPGYTHRDMGECFERFKMGAIMGSSVGACIGAMFGTLAILRRGHGGNGFFPTIGKIMLQSGASFGLFMGIGSLVRCDDRDNDSIDRTIH